MSQETTLSTEHDGIKDMLAAAGYSAKAIKYYTEKPYMGTLPDADQCSEMTGSCGDTMEVYLKVENNVIRDVRYQVMGCAGAVSSPPRIREINVAVDSNSGLEESASSPTGDSGVIAAPPPRHRQCGTPQPGHGRLRSQRSLFTSL